MRVEIKQQHKALLKRLGLKEEDFERFDGKFVRYEFDREKGVRLYDPYYRTSYDEYIDADGWSSWSSEENTFMRNILKPARKEAEERERRSSRPSQEEIARSLKEKFGKKAPSGSGQ